MCVSFVFFVKQKTAYEMRISDWSSDVCSSDRPTQSLSDKPLANHTTISDSRKFRVTVVSTAIKSDTASMTGKAVMLEKVARPKTTSAPILPLAATPRRRTSNTLSKTTNKVENTTSARPEISDTTEH